MTTHFQYATGPADFGTRYQFERAGEGLPPHKHERDQAHTVECVAGRVLVEIDGQKSVELSAGEKLSFDWSVMHSITALEDDTHLFNRALNWHEQPDELASMRLFTGGTL